MERTGKLEGGEWEMTVRRLLKHSLRVQAWAAMRREWLVGVASGFKSTL